MRVLSQREAAPSAGLLLLLDLLLLQLGRTLDERGLG